jgi:threonine/homoserine/homoserine lactone efflux protein
MLGVHDFGLFLAAGLLLNITPGPDNAFIIGRSVQMGWRGGAAAALGISTGCLVHIVGAALGLSALLAASATAFTIVKYAGAAYLLYSGLRMILAKPEPAEAGDASTALTLRAVFAQGVATNVLNPKIALFFLAFLPQFVDADAGHQTLAFLLLGLVFVLNGTLWCLGVAVVAARAAGRLRGSGAARAWINRVLGGVFIALGIRVALMER